MVQIAAQLLTVISSSVLDTVLFLHHCTGRLNNRNRTQITKFQNFFVGIAGRALDLPVVS